MNDLEIAVIGGGLSGLTSAYRLQQKGARVTVLEADSHVGGRNHTDHLEGYRIDTSTQLVGSMYRHFLGLAREVGLQDQLVPVPGRDALWRDGKPHEVVYGSIASMVASGGLPFSTKMRLGATYVPFLKRHGQALDVVAPELAARAGLDEETIVAWGEREIDGTFVRSLVYPQLGAFYGMLPAETSAAFYHILAKQGMEVDLYALAGGVGLLAEALAQRIIAGGGTLLLEAPVTRIEVRSGGVTVESTVGGSKEFAGAISAVPAPTLASVLEGAPPDLQEWLSVARYRPTCSVALLLDRPVPARYFGLSFPQGEATSVAAVCIQENKHHSLVPEGKGLIVAFPTPERAAALVEMQSRQVVDAMLPDIMRPFPGIAATIRHARVYRWSTGVPVFFPGYLRHLGQFRSGSVEGDTRLAVAGEFLYSPSAEGAIYSGERAAERLVARLAR